MKRGDLLRELKNHPEGADVALEILGKDAKRWYTYQRRNEAARLVDMKTGQWVSEFTANKKTYYIRMPNEGIGLLRYTKLKQMLSIVGFDATFNDQLGALNRCVEYANSVATQAPRLDMLFKELENMRAAISKTDRKWDFSFYTATLFIVTENENLKEWNERDAEKKIEDWNKTNIHPQDFFLLVMLWASQLAEQSKELYQTIKAVAGRKSQAI